MPDAPAAAHKPTRPWWLWVIGGLVALVVVGALFGQDSEDNAARPTQTVALPGSPSQAQTTVAYPRDDEWRSARRRGRSLRRSGRDSRRRWVRSRRT
jgi:hypothetical protein